MFAIRIIIKLKLRQNFAGNQKYLEIDSVCLKFLQKEVDVVVRIKNIQNIREKLHKSNEYGLNSLVKI